MSLGRSESAGARFQHQSPAARTFGWVLSLRRVADDSSVLSQRPVDGVQESRHNISQTGAPSVFGRFDIDMNKLTFNRRSNEFSDI